jgi:hypothetical protein
VEGDCAAPIIVKTSAKTADMKQTRKLRFKECCILGFFRLLASIESAVYYALSADFRYKSPKICCSGNPCP